MLLNHVDLSLCYFSTIVGLNHLNLMVYISNSYLLTDAVGQELKYGKVVDYSIITEDSAGKNTRLAGGNVNIWRLDT